MSYRGEIPNGMSNEGRFDMEKFTTLHGIDEARKERMSILNQFLSDADLLAKYMDMAEEWERVGDPWLAARCHEDAKNIRWGCRAQLDDAEARIDRNSVPFT